MIAVRKVGAADRTLEQHVADQREPRGVVDEHHVPGGVTGTVQHVEAVLAERHAVALAQPAIRRHVAHGEAVGAPLLLQPLQQELVALVRPLDRHVAQPFAQFIGAAGMIQMAVGQPDALNRHAGLLDRPHDPIHVAAGIHHDRLLAGIIPQHRAVLLERRDRDDGSLQRAHAISAASATSGSWSGPRTARSAPPASCRASAAAAPRRRRCLTPRRVATGRPDR